MGRYVKRCKSNMECVANYSEIIIAVSAVAISIISLFVAINALKSQEIHNKLAVKPIAHFSKGDYENKIFIKLKNYGMGPLIINKFYIKKDKSSFKRLIDSFDGVAPNIVWDTFTDDIEGRVLAPQTEFTLIEVQFSNEDAEIRQAIRESLSKTTLSIKYSSIYDEVQPRVKEKLDWFSR